MRTPLPSHLGALREGFTLLRRHPVLALALALLAMGLAQLGPALELAAGAGPNPLLQPILGFAGLLPLEMYFIPRLQAQLDAEGLNAPSNPAQQWHETFDGRWLRTFLARLGLSIAIGLGILVFVVPGVLIMTVFGWAPLRMLLRGDGLLPALKWSQAAMARHWPRIVQAVLAMMLVGLVYLFGVTWAVGHFLPTLDPDQIPPAMLRLKHPAFWISNLTTGLLNLWFSCTLLALYQRLEALVQPGQKVDSEA
ncbi:hypothetical protein GETHLI_10810 [Geothrix limicola]|uniref:Glycerophosphoryl diester phosphodiesterase membrane domain-containing protein n=1 Tax=Geothrix limicola TaxID=2927978 RepID=A0ABQ5QCL5_9BACT|nr:hypothetical protein [Geothrix limicola]GLH72579.1 hypothetical protein GETHLI_10810 [Geothrix limicola]